LLQHICAVALLHFSLSFASPLQAVKLLAQLASRLPNLVQLLQPNFDDSEALLLRQGCAQSLELALLDPSAGQSVSSGMAAAAAKAEEQAAGAGE
jgi:hypothetical protein